MSDGNIFLRPVSDNELRTELGKSLIQVHLSNRILPVYAGGRPYAALVSHTHAELLAFVMAAAVSENDELKKSADVLLSYFKSEKLAEIRTGAQKRKTAPPPAPR